MDPRELHHTTLVIFMPFIMEVDKDFASMMIDHHRQAIEMARTQLEHGKDAELRQQAQKIIDDSKKDIEELQKEAKG